MIRAPALRWTGSKWRLSAWITAHFPGHETYTEAFGGAAGVLLRKAPARIEVYNDLSGDAVNFFQVLRDDAQRARLLAAIAATPFSRLELARSWGRTGDPVEDARRLAVRSHMCFTGASAPHKSSGFRTAKDRNGESLPALWCQYPDVLEQVGQRLRACIIEHLPAVEVLRHYDSGTTLHYVDPPYLGSTREPGHYEHELETDAEHLALLDTLRSLKGMVIISGYPSALYARELSEWTQVRHQAAAASRRGSKIVHECLWMNPACADALGRAKSQLDLFSGPLSRRQENGGAPCS